MKPRLVLVPELSEIQWTIRPQLEEWAEVRSFDPPGIGSEAGRPTHDAMVQRALSEIDDAGWDRCILVGDAWASPTVVEVARRQPELVAAIALGHAALSTARTGDRPPVSEAVYDLVTELIASDAPAFLRHGVVQATSGAIDEDLYERLMARVAQDRLAETWRLLTVSASYEKELADVSVPLLFARHDGCVMHTNEGFEDAVARFPHAEVVVVPEAPCADPAFGVALREFCLSVW